MDERLAQAQAALNAGDKPKAIESLVAAIDGDPATPVHIYRVLVTQFYQTGRFAEGEAWAARGLERYPRDLDLLNLRGVLFRKLKRYPEAAAELERAIKVNPKNTAAQSNLGNVLLDMNLGARAEQVFTKLSRLDPRNPDFQRQLGRAMLMQGKQDAGLVRLRNAVGLRKDFIDVWLDMIGSVNEQLLTDEALAICDKALEANPDAERLLEAKAIVMRRGGRLRAAETYLKEMLALHPEAAWAHYQYGSVITDWDRELANVHLRKAVELNPDKLDYLASLVESLERSRIGDEAANIDEAYKLALTAERHRMDFTSTHLKVFAEVFGRVCDFERMYDLGDLKTMGRLLATTNRHTGFLKLLPRVQSWEDRLELLEQHRIWGRASEKQAAARPIKRPPRGPAGEKIRVGFMSSDLRRHPVGYFAYPLFEHLDRSRFEVFVYSYYQGKEDDVQKYIGERIEAYRWWPDISTRDAAQRIADDRLDLLLELGGSTHMNKLDVMSYKPAAKSGSWVGYPHSAGQSAIDYLVVDPHINPESPELLVEKPLMLPKAWYALGSHQFRDDQVSNPQAPFERNGFVTFGTANQPYKYTPDVLRTWAQTLARVPGSRFIFVRPESGSVAFREHISRHFEAEGVSRDRLRFEAVRGRHLPFYNEMDMSLDPFPQTGGTTTCESLWMGAPVVTLVGPAVFERLSYSVLMNLGLPELCATTREGYIDAAVALASDPARLSELRRTLRARMKASPLGRTREWAEDFYQAIEGAVRS